MWQVHTSRLSQCVKLAVCSALVVLPLQSHSALLDLVTTPPYLLGTVQPNVFFTIDDSGSMDWEILTNSYWHFCAYDPAAGGSFSSADCGWQDDEKLFRSYGGGGYRYFEYIYHNADNQYNDDCAGTTNNSVETCPEAGANDWRVYSSDSNVVFYKPQNTYDPWPGACYNDGSDCSNANFHAARSNPGEATTGFSVIRDLDGFSYHVWIDDMGYSGTRPRRGLNSNATIGANGEIDLWDSHLEFVFNGANIEVYSYRYAPTALGIGLTKHLAASLTDPSNCYNVLGSEPMVRNAHSSGSLYVVPLGTNAPGCRTIAQAKQNVANWYEYYRRRGLGVKNVVALTINEYPQFHYGLTALNKHAQLFVELPQVGDNIPAHNADLIAQLYDFEWPPQGTPLRRGLERAGNYYAGDLNKTNPIQNSCQQNFTILLTDALWNGQAPASVTHDADGDGYKGTLSDVARHFYLTDLSPLENNVPQNPYDPATYQHMVTFIVAFGVDGALVDTDGDGWPNPELDVSDNWGDPYNSEAAKIDDMWHGAWNSKGLFSPADTPEEVLNQLRAVLENIQERVSSATSVAQNSTTLQTDSQVYQARFHTLSWKGELLAFPIGLDGKIASAPVWNASCTLTGGACSVPSLTAAQNPGIDPNNRVIITRHWDETQQGVPFRWPANYTNYMVSGSLPDPMTNFLTDAPFSANTTVGSEVNANSAYAQALTDYIRGERSQEESNGGGYKFRDRESILADIIHSDPLFVSEPNRFYPDSLEAQPYSAFKNTYQSRAKIVYTGANDGMLHGFLASDGTEVLAYVPGDRKLWGNMPEYANKSYIHTVFVDGSPVESDVFMNGSWRSILVAALRNGGQSIFGLDITDPSNFTEANANNIFLFEFTDKDDADLGYVHGKISIGKVRTGVGTSEWALIFGNGYNNSEADGHASSTGDAYLYILFLNGINDGSWDSSDYIKIPVGTGSVGTPNGLAAPYVVDIDGDYIIDYVYAGDLNGALWKFDLTSTTPANWAAATTQFFTAYSVTSGDQPITAQPIVGAHPEGLSKGLMVYIGTGKYLENVDNNSTGYANQSFYGLWDKLDGTVPTKADLLQQTITAEVTVNLDSDGDGTNDTTVDYRAVSDNPINWTAPTSAGDPAQHLGWELSLIVSGAASNFGERQVFPAILRNNNIIFTTILPSLSACDFGGDSWLMEVSASTGGQPDATPFDTNDDGVFTSADYILVPDIDGDGQPDYVAPSGLKSSVGITPTPAIFMAPDKQQEIKVMSGSTGLDSVRENPGTGPSGRQNWKQIQ